MVSKQDFKSTFAALAGYKEARERKARKENAQRKAWRALENAGRAPTSPDIASCSTSEEIRWVSLGGNVEDLRSLNAESTEREITNALTAFEVRLATAANAEHEELVRSLTRDGTRRWTEDPPDNSAMLRSLGLDPALAKCNTESEFKEARAKRDGK